MEEAATDTRRDAGMEKGAAMSNTNAVAAGRNTPDGALQGQGPAPAPAQDRVAANLAQHAVHERGCQIGSCQVAGPHSRPPD